MLPTEIKKTSKEWYDECPKEWKLIIVDADGWDRKNFDYSFNEEAVTYDEFMKRVFNSTISCSAKIFYQ